MLKSAEQIEAAFRAACADEIAALKPGNVHRHADGHGMTAADFLRSAETAAPALCAAPGASLGDRVLGAVRATRAAVGQNTNLGILLLCAPLAMGAGGTDLRKGAAAAVASAGVADTAKVFEAIVLAAPGGLGDAPRHDVRAPATVALREAMDAAAPRDRIARQYASGFADVFGDGLAAYRAALARWGDPAWATVAAYLRHLAAGPDSHVLRKLGPGVAARLQQEAIETEALFQSRPDPAGLAPDLLAWDARLKGRGINPGTSADLTVATLFAHRLENGLRGANEHV